MNAIVVRPIRFTDNLGAMQGFLEILGLRPRILSERGGWVEMVAGGGMVALHDAASSVIGATSGDTCLGFDVDDVGDLAERLVGAGVDDVTIYDEAYGQVLSCTDPMGETLQVDSRSDDLYGYRVVESDAPPAGLRVAPIRFTDPKGPMGSWLEALGLTLVDGGDEAYVMYAAGGGEHGYVGLHAVFDDDERVRPGRADALLTFVADEPLADVATRLVVGGYPDARVDRVDFGSVLSVTDPDGQECQVHEVPRADA
jgi:hypothetical protein